MRETVLCGGAWLAAGVRLTCSMVRALVVIEGGIVSQDTCTLVCADEACVLCAPSLVPCGCSMFVSGDARVVGSPATQRAGSGRCVWGCDIRRAARAGAMCAGPIGSVDGRVI